MKFNNKLIKDCIEQNIQLIKKGLAIQNFGNVSSRLDNDHFVIKPSGSNLTKLSLKDMPIIRIKDGKQMLGNLKPSTDTVTHLQIYKKFSSVGGISHSHSKFATAWAQANMKIPILGTTHADFWIKDIPITRHLKKKEIANNYEKNTSKVIFEKMNELKLNDFNCPGILVVNHGPFSWGKNALEAVNISEIMEYIAELAFISFSLNSKSKISKMLSNKHYNRKKSKRAYYGQ